ncbi:hypothetical protein TgHK011_001205 [Trichoderma gracile]|nr:hypothetical protein TgHK011_001205 [Trichoderma gracile]
MTPTTERSPARKHCQIQGRFLVPSRRLLQAAAAASPSEMPIWIRLWSRAPARIPGSMKHDLDRDPLGARGCSSALLACFLSPALCALLRGLCGLFDSFDSARILSLARGLCWDPPILFCRATGHDTSSRVGSGPSVVYLHGPASTGSRLLAPPLPASVNLTRVNE